MIPHQIDNYQVDARFNKCMSCHEWFEGHGSVFAFILPFALPFPLAFAFILAFILILSFVPQFAFIFIFTLEFAFIEESVFLAEFLIHDFIHVVHN